MPLALPQLLTLLVVCLASYASGFLLTSPSAATTSSMTAAMTLLSHADTANIQNCLDLALRVCDSKFTPLSRIYTHTHTGTSLETCYWPCRSF